MSCKSLELSRSRRCCAVRGPLVRDQGVIPAPARGARMAIETTGGRPLTSPPRRVAPTPRPRPEDAGRLARLCLERGDIDARPRPVAGEQRAAIVRQRADLDRLEGELLDLEMTIAAAGRPSRSRPVPAAPIRVLFVCTHNRPAARSPRRCWRLRRRGLRCVLGEHDVSQVNGTPSAALGRARGRLERARSKAITGFLDQQFDYVITVCDRARATCPVFPSR